MHACAMSGCGFKPNDDMEENDLRAASTRFGSAVISSGVTFLRASLSRYLLPPMPHM